MIQKGDTFIHNYMVNQRVYEAFIDLFKDKNPLHTDELFAKQYAFRSKVMHGNILNGFISHFVGECLPIKNVIIQSQTNSYSKPVYLNDKLTLHVIVSDYFDSVKTIEMKYYFENSNLQKVSKGKISISIL